MGSFAKAFVWAFAVVLLLSAAPAVKAQTQNVTQIIPNSINNVNFLNVTILSPENKTYNMNHISLIYTWTSNATPCEFVQFGTLFGLYSTDGVALDRDIYVLMNLVEDTYGPFPEDAPVRYTNLGNQCYVGNATLTNLSEGYHNVTIWMRAAVDWISYDCPTAYSFTTVSFYVDSIPPSISILNEQNQSYTTNDIAISFTANKTLSAMSYSLDGTENATIAGNFTLSGLSNGHHNVTIYGTDEVGNTGSQTLNFTVEKLEPKAFDHAATISVIAVPVALVCLIAGFLLYKKHRKANYGNQTKVCH